jgi:hypothetical protein
MDCIFILLSCLLDDPGFAFTIPILRADACIVDPEIVKNKPIPALDMLIGYAIPVVLSHRNKYAWALPAETPASAAGVLFFCHLHSTTTQPPLKHYPTLSANQIIIVHDTTYKTPPTVAACLH